MKRDKYLQKKTSMVAKVDSQGAITLPSIQYDRPNKLETLMGTKSNEYNGELYDRILALSRSGVV